MILIEAQATPGAAAVVTTRMQITVAGLGSSVKMPVYIFKSAQIAVVGAAWPRSFWFPISRTAVPDRVEGRLFPDRFLVRIFAQTSDQNALFSAKSQAWASMFSCERFSYFIFAAHKTRTRLLSSSCAGKTGPNSHCQVSCLYFLI